MRGFSKALVRKWHLSGTVPICNEHRERGVFIRGYCLPLCWRCSSIVAGLIFAYAICLLNPESGVRHNPLMALLFLPLLLDVSSQVFEGRTGTKQRRALTGLLAGVGIPSIAHLSVSVMMVLWS